VTVQELVKSATNVEWIKFSPDQNQ